jgi:N-acyl-D-aspartate/D-glutamate deacylase
MALAKATKVIISIAILAGAYMILNKPSGEKVDILIIGGLVYNGDIAPPKQATIAITGDRIVFVGENGGDQFSAAKTIDATGFVITPGFIDPHTHASDEVLSTDKNANINYLTQGVTTVFIGNDGRGPVNVSETINKLNTQGIGTNVAMHVGFGTVRTQVMGGEDRAPTADEMEAMKALIDQAMSEGAMGFSTGLWYAPQNFSQTEEVIELAKVAANHGGVYSSHLRDEGSFKKGLINSVTETLRIARESDIAVNFTHIKALGVDVWGKSAEFISLVEAAHAEGLNVTADQYPWPASGTNLTNAIVPRWALAPSRKALLTRLADPEVAPGLIAEIKENLRRRGGAKSLLITHTKLEGIQGNRLSEIAAERGTEPLATAIALISEGIKKGETSSVASFNMNPEDIRAFAAQPWVMSSSDGSTGHPRKFASFPKGYRDLVVNDNVMTMEQFVHRSSALAADTFGIKDRGRIKVGAFADISVLDLETFAPKADFENPALLSTGVRHLIVNGIVTIEDSNYTGVLGGKGLKKK